MKDLDNLSDSEEKKSSNLRTTRIILILILCLGFSGAFIFSWEKITNVGKEIKTETIQIPVAKINPEPDLTFYKNLKNKNESSGNREKIVGLIPPTTSPNRSGATSTENSFKKGTPENRSLSPRYTLQVASMKDHQKALYLSERLTRKGFPSYIIPAEIPEKGTYYRVRIGHYVTKKAAEESLRQLKQKGEKEAIIAKENVLTRTR